MSARYYRRPLRRLFLRARLVFQSLLFNSHLDCAYALETLISPLVRFGDAYVFYLGPAFVSFLLSMIGLVILLTYTFIVPYEWIHRTPVSITHYLIVGHYLLVNTLFHYAMAWRTPPGLPPPGHRVVEAVGMCKKCIAPKPPRTHHCSICNRCILEMDHHCVWLNQCVGYYNRRHFFLTMAFMWIGCVYICLGSWPCFRDHFWNVNSTAPWCTELLDTLPYARYACGASAFPRRVAENSEEVQLTHGVSAHNSTVFVFFTAVAMVLGLGLLLAWHASLIHRGETSVEQHINSATAARFARLGLTFRNPYDCGWRQNWRVFLGIDCRHRSFWRHVLLPSSHKPNGNGLTFRSATYHQQQPLHLP